MEIKQRGWEQRVLTQHRGARVDLATLPGYWIVPKKLTMDGFAELLSSNVLDIDNEVFNGKSEEEVRDLLSQEIKKSRSKWDKEKFKQSVRLAFLYGVHDHNFDTPIDVKTGNYIDPTTLPEPLPNSTDEQYTAQLKEKGIEMKKVAWDELLYDKLYAYPQTLIEIFSVVMAFNRPLEKGTSEKSTT